jgi:hypothetical protein
MDSTFVLGVNLLNDTPVAIKFEPRKSDAPQLRDEYRTYKLLSGSGTLFVTISLISSLNLSLIYHDDSWNPERVLFRPRRSSQYFGD